MGVEEPMSHFRSTTLLLGILSGVLNASEGYPLETDSAFYWTPAVSKASTRDFIDKITALGFGLEAIRRIREEVGIGLSFRWIHFEKDFDNKTFTVNGVPQTGTESRSMDSLPILFHARYLFRNGEESVRPFFGFGLGPAWGRRESSLGPVTQNQAGWQFMVSPEAGLFYYGSSPKIGLYFSLRYDAGLGSDAIAEVSYLSAALGVSSRF